MKVVLKKVHSIHNNVRTEVTEGSIAELPTIGKRLVVYSSPIEEGKDIRVIATSQIKALFFDGYKYTITTENSTYELKLLDNEEGV